MYFSELELLTKRQRCRVLFFFLSFLCDMKQRCVLVSQETTEGQQVIGRGGSF